MALPRVKICGITSVADALVACAAGADAIGLVFHAPSPRSVSLQQAGEIVRRLPPFVACVGLFVNAPVELMRSVAGELRLTHLQLHGEESPQVVAQLREYRVIKALPVRAGLLAEDVRIWRQAIEQHALDNLCALLLDSDSAVRGGSGRENDWEQIAAVEAAGGFAGMGAIILAGGLHSDNVAAVLRRVHPDAVDVSSGVESAPGIKSAEKIRQFIRQLSRPAAVESPRPLR